MKTIECSHCGLPKDESEYYVRKHGLIKYCKECYNKQAVGYRKSKGTEYTIWVDLKQRCNNPKASGYKRYGGRGITVCERWQNSFVDFFEDMGARPSSLHSIDRENNDGNYEPGNCRWATAAQQGQNSSNAKLCMDDAREIRWLHDVGHVSMPNIARAFMVGVTCVWSVIHHRTWKESAA